jgi:hypothetical protein
MSICVYKTFNEWKVVETEEQKNLAIQEGYFESPADALAKAAIEATEASIELSKIRKSKNKETAKKS